MTDDQPVQIAADAIAGEEAIAVAVATLERMHGHHLAEMSAEEQAEARAHWRRQAEEILAAVRSLLGGSPAPGSGRAAIWFSDASDGRVHVSASFQPQLQDAGGEEVTGTPAQLLALQAFAAVSGEAGPVQPGEEQAD